MSQIHGYVVHLIALHDICVMYRRTVIHLAVYQPVFGVEELKENVRIEKMMCGIFPGILIEKASKSYNFIN